MINLWGKGKAVGAVQWAKSTQGEDHLPFKAMAGVFGCIPDCRESSLGLDLSFNWIWWNCHGVRCAFGRQLRTLTIQIWKLHVCQQQRWTWKQMLRHNSQLEYITARRKKRQMGQRLWYPRILLCYVKINFGWKVIMLHMIMFVYYLLKCMFTIY